ACSRVYGYPGGLARSSLRRHSLVMDSGRASENFAEAVGAAIRGKASRVRMIENSRFSPLSIGAGRDDQLGLLFESRPSGTLVRHDGLTRVFRQLGHR